MSGHNKWSTIKHKKGAADAKRGKVFSRLAKEITLAARDGGGDVEMNPRLRSAVSAGKAVNMPNDNIDRAVKKGTGELAGGTLDELNYEGYAPGGVAVIVQALSDNRNRTAAEVRNIFNKYNCNMASSGAVSWMFQRRARFLIEGEAANEEALFELLLGNDVDVEEINVEDGVAEIIGTPEAFGDIVAALEGEGIEVSESSVTMIPETTTEITDTGTARSVLKFIDVLEDDDDVQSVVSNLEISDELMEELANED
ncbi:MAG: YebC/PmpR family DNA-binding transcriptional regulator [Victivallales bacterium]|jgi:YebC/PmpR family DNA-binding regulatory protein|nr:YebC/PmpR family DNA-binding transcriptional regulator [Victivallales bacterium]